MELPNNRKKLRVAVLGDGLPYSTCKPKIKGITIEIWEETAKIHNLEYEYVCYPRNFDYALEALNDDIIDIVLGDISVISRRYNLALYTRPFYISELYIYRKSKDSSFFDILTNIDLKNVLYIITLIIVIYTLLVMFILNMDFISAFYKTFLSFLTIGGEIIPTKINKISNVHIKLFNTFWSIFIFFFRAFIISRIIASVVSQKNIINNDELKQVNDVNVLKGSAFYDFVKSINKNPVENINNNDIIKKLNESNNSYWFEDLNVINDELKRSNNIIKLDKTERPVMNDEYTIAVNKKLPNILNMINSTLVELQSSGDILHICKGYIDTTFDRCLL